MTAEDYNAIPTTATVERPEMPRCRCCGVWRFADRAVEMAWRRGWLCWRCFAGDHRPECKR